MFVGQHDARRDGVEPGAQSLDLGVRGLTHRLRLCKISTQLRQFAAGEQAHEPAAVSPGAVAIPSSATAARTGFL